VLPMRLIYERGQEVGPRPAGYYVYVWRHDENNTEYVGSGRKHRWKDHTKPNRSDDNQKKDRYFRKHLQAMTCSIIIEGLATEADAREREEIERDLRERAGTHLLNKRRVACITGPRGKRDLSSRSVPNQLWVRLRNLLREHPITPNAILRRRVGGGYEKRGGGAEYMKLYPAPGESIMVADMLARGRADEFRDRDQRGHLAWDFVHGFFDLILPEGETIHPGHCLPSEEMVREWRREIEANGTRASVAAER
jgi:hypothetical protein